MIASCSLRCSLRPRLAAPFRAAKLSAARLPLLAPKAFHYQPAPFPFSMEDHEGGFSSDEEWSWADWEAPQVVCPRMRVSNLSLPNSLERTYSCAYSMESYEGIDDDFDWEALMEDN